MKDDNEAGQIMLMNMCIALAMHAGIAPADFMKMYSCEGEFVQKMKDYKIGMVKAGIADLGSTLKKMGEDAIEQEENKS